VLCTVEITGVTSVVVTFLVIQKTPVMAAALSNKQATNTKAIIERRIFFVILMSFHNCIDFTLSWPPKKCQSLLLEAV
jgi:hypothetical protein